MGKTAFGGPVYGAKSLLLSVSRDNGSASTGSTAAVILTQMLVPAYEDWYATEFRVTRGSTGSTDFSVFVEDDSTNIASVASASSLANQHGSTTIAADAGEYEGKRIAAGSSLVIKMWNGGSSLVASSAITASLYGYIRWISSTRAEA